LNNTIIHLTILSGALPDAKTEYKITIVA